MARWFERVGSGLASGLLLLGSTACGRFGFEHHESAGAGGRTGYGGAERGGVGGASHTDTGGSPASGGEAPGGLPGTGGESIAGSPSAAGMAGQGGDLGVGGNGGGATMGGSNDTGGRAGVGGGEAVGGEAGGAGDPSSTGGTAQGGSNDTGGQPGSGGREAVGGMAGAAGDHSNTGGTVVGGAAGSGGAEVLDYCRELPALVAAPTIDGVLDGGFPLLPVIPVGWSGKTALREGIAMSYAAAWRPDGVYLFISVNDPERNPAREDDPVWMGDAVEIYVDSNGVYPPANAWDDPGARQFVIGAPEDDATPSARGEHYIVNETGVEWESTEFVALPTPTGFAVEVFIVALDLGLADWSLSAGDAVGIDLGHDVSFPIGVTGWAGNRDSQYFLRLLDPRTYTGDDFPFFNENAFCTAVLLPE
ncbi:MAG: hypothetical protein JW751_11545 [Polyangiaceae bacterium]|nr:hypothetical protein [Polyangiaceae bacterium]